MMARGLKERLRLKGDTLFDLPVPCDPRCCSFGSVISL
jgi:hypothetical protein